MKREAAGIEFEKLVYEIQKRIDPGASITHSERIADRIGQLRQFDIVIRGVIGGHVLLGVIECKDLNRKVGTPELDAFITKAQDINANFKIVISRKGFTKTALDKARHYGVQTFSLLPSEAENLGFIVGQTWFADIYSWRQFMVTLKPQNPDEAIPPFKPENLKLDGKPVLDWFKNYLLKNHPLERELGWSVAVEGMFRTPQEIHLDESTAMKCSGIEFRAERILDKRKKLVGITGPGFFDWQNGQVKFGQKVTIETHPISSDFYEWEIATDADLASQERGILHVRIITHSVQFPLVEDAIDLEALTH